MNVAGYPESKFRWAIEKNKNLFPNHLYCHLMYIPYAIFDIFSTIVEAPV
jgi:hypothetical protein